jgi:hypothetical protein
MLTTASLKDIKSAELNRSFEWNAILLGLATKSNLERRLLAPLTLRSEHYISQFPGENNKILIVSFRNLGEGFYISGDVAKIAIVFEAHDN